LVNDTFGHPAGDYVLGAVAERVARITRREDFLARYGGEEFAILCRGASTSETVVLGERLRATVEAGEYRFEGRDVSVTVSVGIAGYPSAGVDDGAALIARADGALYRAKERGRNCVEVV
jgi:diguanylate cyclase